MGDILSHEIAAVSWFLRLIKDQKPVVPPFKETTAQWTKRARLVTRTINGNYDVEGLCAEFPSRLSEVVKRDGPK